MRVLVHCGWAALLLAGPAFSQNIVQNATQDTPASPAAPIAIVPTEGLTVTGALEVTNNRAVIGASGTVTAGAHAAKIILPHRGELKICSTTRVALTTDSGVPAGEVPGLMMSLERGAMETNFATGQNSDVILTPDFRVLISPAGSGAVAGALKVRLGDGGDLCVDNPVVKEGGNTPYVTVSSLFEGGAYRVMPGQHVMFVHGSLQSVIDNEKESCGCPAETIKSDPGNPFPEAESAGLAPLTPPPGNAKPAGEAHAQVSATLSYDGSGKGSEAAMNPPAQSAPAVPTHPGQLSAPKQTRPGMFQRIGNFFAHLFGAD